MDEWEHLNNRLEARNDEHEEDKTIIIDGRCYIYIEVFVMEMGRTLLNLKSEDEDG